MNPSELNRVLSTLPKEHKPLPYTVVCYGANGELLGHETVMAQSTRRANAAGSFWFAHRHHKFVRRSEACPGVSHV